MDERDLPWPTSLPFLTTGEIEFRKWLVEQLQKIELQLIEIKGAIVENQTAQAKIDALAEQIRQSNEKLKLFTQS